MTDRRHIHTMNKLRGDMAGWFSRPSLVSSEPRGMPLHPAELPAARMLVAEGLATLNGDYLQPIDQVHQ